MTLDPTLVYAVVAIILADKIFAWALIIVLLRGQRAQTFPVPKPAPGPPAPIPAPSPGPEPAPAPQPAPGVPTPGRPSPVAPAPGGPGIPAPQPAPAPAPVPPVAPATIFRNTGITATSWAGTGDDNTSAYTRKNIDGNHTIGYSLPARIEARPPARIRSPKTGRTVSAVPLLDVGPWNGITAAKSDPYWATGARPQAESGTDLSGRHTNHAGIDLTPACWAALGYTGNLNQIKDIVDWDFESHFTDPVAPGVPVSPVGPAQPTTVSVGTVLQHNTWPEQSQAELFFGSPGSNLVSVQCPWQLIVEGTKSTHNTITIHQKCAASLTRVLNYIWEQCGKSQAQIDAFGYNIFDGSFNERPIGGTHTPSQHSWAAAIDWNAAANPQHATAAQTKFKEDSLIVTAFKAEGWTWGGDWSPAYRDAMHVQLLRA